MWAQLVKTRLKPGVEDQVAERGRALATRGNEAMVRTITLSNQSDPLEHYILTIFTSEEEARRCECEPQQHAMIMELMDFYDAPPEFVDLVPLHEEVGTSTP